MVALNSTLSFPLFFPTIKPIQPTNQNQVYKRALDVEYSLKMKASRAVFSEISKRFSTMPFSLRALSTPGARLGVSECVNHYLLQAFPVLPERPGERVARLCPGRTGADPAERRGRRLGAGGG